MAQGVQGDGDRGFITGRRSRRALSAGCLGFVPGLVPGQGQRILARPERRNRRIVPGGTDFHGPWILPSSPLGSRRRIRPGPLGGSNLGPISKRLVGLVSERVAAYRAENGLPAEALVPADAVTASGSGLDPHVSLENARLQASRIARARGLTEAQIRRLIEAAAEGREMGIFGEPRVNVLLLNLALDGAADGGR